MLEHSSTSLPPGPRLPRPVQSLLWWRRTTQYLDWCRERWGPRFTVFAPPWGKVVVLADPEDIKTLFSAPAEEVRAGEAYARIFGRLMGPRSLFVLDGEEHLRTRRMLLPAFHGESVQRYRSLIRSLAAEEVETWAPGSRVQLQPRMERLALEVVLRAVFGVDDVERLATFRRELPRVVGPGTVIVFAWMLPGLAGVPPWRGYWRLVDRTHALLDEEVARRRRDPGIEERTDVLSQLILARDDAGRGLTDADLRDELLTLMIAGHETTATGLAWTFERLMRHPGAMDRAREDDEYLDAAIRETLRVRPVVFGTQRRLAADLEIGGGYRLPAGIHAAAASCAVQRSPGAHEDALEWRPERFLDGGPPRYANIPFGGGVRRCLGASFAMVEMNEVVRTVLERVELAPVRPDDEAQPCKHATHPPSRGAEAVVVRRRGPSRRPEPPLALELARTAGPARRGAGVVERGGLENR